MDNRKVTGILSHIWDLSSQIWRLWTNATTIPNFTTYLLNHLPPFSDHLPLPLIWYQSPISLIPVTPFSHSHYSGDQLLLPPIWWPLSTSTSWVSTSHSDHSGNNLLLPPLQWLPPTLTNPLTTSQSHHSGDFPLLPLSHSHPSRDNLPFKPFIWPSSIPSTLVTTSYSQHSGDYIPLQLLHLLSAVYNNFHTPYYTLPSYSKPKYSLPNMFLPTTSTTTTTSTKNQGYQNHKNNPASPKTFTSNTTFTSSTATYTTMSTTNQGSFTTIINNNHHNYSTTTTSLLPLHHTPTTLQPNFLEFPGEALQFLFLSLWINHPDSFHITTSWSTGIAEERLQTIYWGKISSIERYNKIVKNMSEEHIVTELIMIWRTYWHLYTMCDWKDLNISACMCFSPLFIIISFGATQFCNIYCTYSKKLIYFLMQ